MPLAAGWLFSQERPQLVWQAQVRGVAVLYIKGKHLEVDQKGGALVQEQRSHFYHPLPDTGLDVRMAVFEGRGSVRILEQPTIDNNYTLALAIEDRQEGLARYSLAFYWDTSGEMFEHSRGSSPGGRLTWKGRVAGEVIVSCRQRTCESSAIGGLPVLREKVRFSRPLPDSEVEIRLENIEGRGEIRLLEPPLEKNDYTARVRILDSSSGRSDSAFSLAWSQPRSAGTLQPVAQRGLLWRGRVQGRVRVAIQGGAAISEVLEGQPVTGESADFYQPLPSRSGRNATLKKLAGRGRTQIVEIPSQQNHYQLVFEIDGREEGADNYEIEVDW